MKKLNDRLKGYFSEGDTNYERLQHSKQKKYAGYFDRFDGSKVIG